MINSVSKQTLISAFISGAALVNFCEACPKNILTQYLDAIMRKLEAILSAKFNELVEKGTKLVLEQVVTTIASVADTAEEQFAVYYDRYWALVINLTLERIPQRHFIRIG